MSRYTDEHNTAVIAFQSKLVTAIEAEFAFETREEYRVYMQAEAAVATAVNAYNQALRDEAPAGIAENAALNLFANMIEAIA